ncbi:MAG TPA: calcium:proton antiporter, partial [Candidatus Brachybacterium merdavium]|nr:calcium:proton antiporter [Candidatus Brachybacterium merdavium]
MPSSPARSQEPSTWRTVLTRAAITRLAVGWCAVLLGALAAPLLPPPVPAPLLIGALAMIIGVILWCAFGVVHEAEALAHRLGDPYGTLILTLSVVVIEVILIASVMLGPGDHTTIARDSVMAVSMIILNLVVGMCLVISGLRYGNLPVNRVGTSAYLVMLAVLITTGFALPAVIGTDGVLGSGQAMVVATLTIGLYAVFLWRQTGAQAADFREAPGMPPSAARPGQDGTDA